MSDLTPTVGVIYGDDRPEFADLKRSAMRMRVDQIVQDAVNADPFDAVVAKAVAALVEVLDLHQPWMFFEQRFLPTYVGDEFMGSGCRACGVDRQHPDCWTVREIARSLGVS